MTRTKAARIDSHIALRLAMLALFAMIAFGYTSQTAHAQYRQATGNSNGNNNWTYNVKQESRAVVSQKDLDSIMARIADLEKKKQELMDTLEKQKNGKATTTPRGGGKDWKDTFCKNGNGSNLPSELRKRICDRWKPHSTSTPDTRPPQASTSAMIKLQHPNAGVAFKHPIDGAVIIKWRNTTGDKTVDIDLKKGSTTTSIAKNVTGKRITEDGDVLGVSTRTSTHDGGGDRGSSVIDKIRSTYGAAKVNPGQGKQPQLYGYRWKDAPVGDGYKIVLTVKDGTKTYTDESDKEFSVKKNPKGNNWYDTDAATNGDVLGASTTAEMQTDMVLSYLEDTLAEMSVALTL